MSTPRGGVKREEAGNVEAEMWRETWGYRKRGVTAPPLRLKCSGNLGGGSALTGSSSALSPYFALLFEARMRRKRAC